MILRELLSTCDGTCQDSMSILGIALLSRWHFHLVSNWASSAIRKHPGLSFISSSPSTSISILCKHLGCICAFCNNKARQPYWHGEVSDGPRICDACQPISAREYCALQTSYDAKALLRGRLFSEAYENGGMDGAEMLASDRSCLLPHLTDLLLLREFRYRFDPNWRPEACYDRKLEEYIQFVTPWADSGKWNDRPWAMQNFPKPPRFTFVAPNLRSLSEWKKDCFYRAYQSICAKIRALCKIFPQILRAPEVWRRCMMVSHRHSTLAEDVKIALEKEGWRESPQKDCKFQIQNRDGEYDVEFVGRGFNLEYGNCQNRTRKQRFGNWWAEIIEVRKGQVFTQSWRVVV